MENLKTYNIYTDISLSGCNIERLHEELSMFSGITNFNGIDLIDENIIIKGDLLTDINGLDNIILNHNPEYFEYKILKDSDENLSKSFKSINYKTELKSNISYTPIFKIHSSGQYAGFLNYTDYYKNYIDSNNPGEHILRVEEKYDLDFTNNNYENSARPTTGRTKTWKWVKSDGSLDEENVKVKYKLYDTRVKRRNEGERRRQNIIEQLTDNVGLAGILSGVFTGETHAHQMLTILLEEHAADFSGWKTSGLGSLVDNLNNNNTSTWLDNTVLDTPQTQYMCPWMIGMTFREYFIEKLKGNID
jgi:hypothetical protein